MSQTSDLQLNAIDSRQLLRSASGFIFDMDDLLVKSQSIWRGALSNLLLGAGKPVDLIDRLNYRGLSAADTAKLFHRSLGINTEAESFQRDFVDQLLNEINRRPVIALPGALTALHQASRLAPVAVASGSPIDVIHGVLTQLGVIDSIKVVLSSDEVSLGKPEPDVFLEAARLLKQSPADCVVFEDSYVGVKAAIAAKIPCVAVPSEAPEAIRSMTPYSFNSLSHLPW